MKIDREGTFMARPISWGVKTAKDTQAVAINMGFLITAQRDGDQWTDWTGYGDHHAYGDYWIVKKDGTINTQTVDNLVRAFGADAVKWMGDLRKIDGPPPDTMVQIVVKEDEYQGVVRYKAAWINAADYEPQPFLADAQAVGGLQGRFGSMLRAAASASAKAIPAAAPNTAGTRTVAEARAALQQDDEVPMPTEEDLPF